MCMGFGSVEFHQPAESSSYASRSMWGRPPGLVMSRRYEVRTGETKDKLFYVLGVGVFFAVRARHVEDPGIMCDLQMRVMCSWSHTPITVATPAQAQIEPHLKSPQSPQTAPSLRAYVGIAIDLPVSVECCCIVRWSLQRSITEDWRRKRRPSIKRRSGSHPQCPSCTAGSGPSCP
jgi:hypothetical protein